MNSVRLNTCNLEYQRFTLSNWTDLGVRRVKRKARVYYTCFLIVYVIFLLNTSSTIKKKFKKKIQGLDN